MTVTGLPAEVLRASGYVPENEAHAALDALVVAHGRLQEHADSLDGSPHDFASAGVPKKTRVDGTVWVPAWAPELIYAVASIDDIYGWLVSRAVKVAALAEDPSQQARELCTTTMLGGVGALEGMLDVLEREHATRTSSASTRTRARTPRALRRRRLRHSLP